MDHVIGKVRPKAIRTMHLEERRMDNTRRTDNRNMGQVMTFFGLLLLALIVVRWIEERNYRP